jgi:hypothetical protein
MADLQLYQNRVNGGEISPQLEGRVDNERYNSGARLLENFIVKPNGSISKRPGTQYLASLGDTAGRLETYRADEETNFMLVFTPSACRVYNTSGTAVTTTSGVMDIAPIQWFSDPTNLIWFTQELVYSPTDNRYYKRFLGSANVPDPAKGGTSYDQYTFQPGEVVLSGSAPGRAFKAKSAFTDYAPLTNTEFWQELENVAQTPAPYYTEEFYDDIWTPYTADEIFEVQTTQINDLLFCAHKNHKPLIIARDGDGKWKSYYTNFTFGAGTDYNTTSNTLKIQPIFSEWDKDAAVWGFTIAGWPTYYENDYVKYANYFYRVKADHTLDGLSAFSALSATYYELVEYYIDDKTYNSNDLVYTSKTNHTPVTATNSEFGEPGITTGAWSNNWSVGYTNTVYTSWQRCFYDPCTPYYVNDRITHNGENYRCILQHTSNNYRLTEPGVGEEWYTYWELLPKTVSKKGADEYYLVSNNSLFTQDSINDEIQVVINQPNNVGSINIGTMATDSTSATDSYFYQGDYIVSTSWTVGNALSGGSTIQIQESLDNINFQTIREWNFDGNKVSNNISFTGETPSTGAWYKVIINKIGVGGAGALTLENVINTTTFNCRVIEYISPIKVRVKIKAGNTEIIPTKAWNIPTTVYKESAFSVKNGYPSTVAFHEQRLWFGGVSKFPGRIWGSAKNRLYDYRTGVLDTDAIDITIASKSTNQTSWLQSINRNLVVGTAGEIYTIDSGSTSSNITPTSVRAQLRTSMGSSTIPGKVVGDSILFIQTGSNRLREFIYTDQTDSFIAPDLNIMADHIAEDKFIQTAYQSNLDQTLWIVNSKGALLGYTFDFTEGVGAWHRHFTGSRSDFYGVSGTPSVYDNVIGKPDMFTSVATLNPEGQSLTDQVWFIVKRWVNGQYKYFIERFDPTNMDFIFGSSDSTVERWRFIDSYREYDMSNPDDTGTESIGDDTYNYNLFYSHLNSGTTMYILSAGGTGWNDFYGDPGGRITYESGNGGIKILLDASGLQGSFAVGLPVYSVYQPTRIDVNMGNGGSQGRLFRLNRFSLRLWRSYGGSFNVYDPIQYTVGDAVTKFEFRPVEGDSITAIDYDKFTFNLSNQYPKITNDPYYTGQTSDQHVNGNWSNNPIFTIVHNEPRPFNILGVVYKAEVSSN